MSSNTIITCSNLFAIVPIYKALMNNNSIGALITFCAMFASMIYHTSETNHGLPSIIFKKYTKILLFIDIIFAFIAITYGIYIIYINNYIYNITIIYSSIISLLFLQLSELTDDNTLFYVLYHSLWHCCAFLTLAIII